MKKIIISVFIIALLVTGFIAWNIFGPTLNVPEGKYYYIRTGASMETVKENLLKEKIIRTNLWVNKVTGILKYTKVKPGRYEIKKGMSLYKMITMLRRGEQSIIKMVIIKERTKELFAGKMGKKFDFEIDSLQMMNFLNSNDSLKKFDVDTNTVMAIVMPYTYLMNWNISPGKMFEQFQNAYQQFWTAERKVKADKLNLSPLQVASLASIVEEETNKKTDKYNIASTYLNRIKVGMKLQADPTVKFAMKNFALKRIVGVHLNTNSPFNTYMYKGIPPGPICTPSVESINAVLDAPSTQYLYFVASSKFDGSSVFTTNFADHTRYARLYQQELTKRIDSVKKVNANK
ncbi:MAG: endolytic transglycosylase MltG [Chitinophagaceae bacterium]